MNRILKLVDRPRSPVTASALLNFRHLAGVVGRYVFLAALVQAACMRAAILPVTLTWVDNSGGDATGFEIERNDGDIAGWHNVGNVAATTVTYSETVNVTALTMYRVRAVTVQ